MDEMLPRDGTSEKEDLEDAELDSRIRKLEEELAELRALRVRRRTESKKREFTGSDYERLLRNLEKMGFSRQAAAPVLDDCAKQAASDEEILKSAVERLISAGANDSIHLEEAPLELSHSSSSSSHTGPFISAPSSSSSHVDPPPSLELQQLISMGFDSKEAAAAIEKEGPNMERLIEVMLGRVASSHGREEKHAVLEETAKVKQTKQTVGGGRFSTPLKRPVPRNDKLEMPLLDCDSPAALDHTRDQPRLLLRSHSPGVSEVKAPPKKQKLEERGELVAGVDDEAMKGDRAESEHEHNADFLGKSQDCIGPAPEEAVDVTFMPGQVGCDIEEDIVTDVYDEGQARREGVKVGWKIKAVNGQACNSFFDDLFEKAKVGKEPYRVTFLKAVTDIADAKESAKLSKDARTDPHEDIGHTDSSAPMEKVEQAKSSPAGKSPEPSAAPLAEASDANIDEALDAKSVRKKKASSSLSLRLLAGSLLEVFKKSPAYGAALQLDDCPRIVPSTTDDTCLAKGQVRIDPSIVEKARTDLEKKVAEAATLLGQRTSGALGDFLDTLDALILIMAAANQSMRQDISKAGLELPPFMAAWLGTASPEWDQAEVWNNILKEVRTLHANLQPKGSERRSLHYWPVVSPGVDPSPNLDRCSGQWRRKDGDSKLIMDSLVVAKQNQPALFHKDNACDSNTNYSPKVLQFRQGSKALASVSSTPYYRSGHDLIVQNLRCGFRTYLIRAQKLWPPVFAAAEHAARIAEFKTLAMPQPGMSALLERSFGENCNGCLLETSLGIDRKTLLGCLGGCQSWRPLQGVAQALRSYSSNAETQMKVLKESGVVEIRTRVSKVEKDLDETSLVPEMGTSIKHDWWFCEGCDKWFQTPYAPYAKKTKERSDPTTHVCGTEVDLQRPGPEVTAKPRKFEIIKGCNLGLQLLTKPYEEVSGKIDVSLCWNVERVLEFLQYASGLSADRICIEARIADALAPDGLESGDKGAEEDVEEEAESGNGESAPPSKRPCRRTSSGALSRASSGALSESSKADDSQQCEERTGAVLLSNNTGRQRQRLSTFNILSCKDSPKALADIPNLLLPLYPAQQRTVFWMATREGIKVPGFSDEEVAFPGFVSTQRTARRLGATDVSAQLRIQRFYESARGGLLADSVGYGKTAAVLGLVALSQLQGQASVAASPSARHVSAKGTLVVVPANLHDQWKNEVTKFIGDKNAVCICISTFTDIKKLTVRELRDADIVVVSQRLFQSKAYQQHLDTLTGVRQPSNFSIVTAAEQYQEAMKKWQVNHASWERSAQFMRIHYRMYPHYQHAQPPAPIQPKLQDFKDKKKVTKTGKGSKLAIRQELLAQLTADLLSLCDGDVSHADKLQNPPLEMFHWRRLVVDELHEVLRGFDDIAFGAGSGEEMKSLVNSIHSLEAGSRWGLTATPDLTNARKVSSIARFHRVFVPWDDDVEAQHYLDEYARSNDWDDSTIPLETHLIKVRHTARERALYLNEKNHDNPDHKRMLEICNIFSPSGTDANAEAAVASTRLENETVLQRHRTAMEKSAQEMQRLEIEARAGFPTARDEEERKKRADKLKRLRDGREAAEKKERHLESRVKYFEEMLKELQKLDKEEVECPMCLERLESNVCMVTHCGHLFCRDCIEGWIKDQHGRHCPTCKHSLDMHNLLPASDVLSSERESEGRVSMFGSKVNAVCLQLDAIWQKDKEAKVIIFVQFEVLLRKMQEALSDLKLPCLTLKGSIFERRKVIRSFQQPGDDSKILLLSLEKSPSGMNLVCCHHLLLVHPMQAESKSAALGFERQAIGRVRRRGQSNVVNVYRFFVRDTIEEQLTHSHHAELLADDTADVKADAEDKDAAGAIVA